MIIAKVVGNVVATKKSEALTGKKLMLISPFADGLYDLDRLNVAVDSVGAGIGETVLVATGGAARSTDADTESPIDMKIVGIVDEVDICNKASISGGLV